MAVLFNLVIHSRDTAAKRCSGRLQRYRICERKAERGLHTSVLILTQDVHNPFFQCVAFKSNTGVQLLKSTTGAYC